MSTAQRPAHRRGPRFPAKNLRQRICLGPEQGAHPIAHPIPPNPPKSIGDADFDPGATSSAGLPITYKSSNTDVATIVNGRVHIVGPGTTFIEAYQNGDDTYSSALKQFQKLTVSR